MYKRQLGGRGSFPGRGDEPGALGNGGLRTGKVIRSTGKGGLMGVQGGLRGGGFLGLRLFVGEIGAGGGELCFSGDLVTLELLVTLDHGIELAQYAGGFCVFLFGAG